MFGCLIAWALCETLVLMLLRHPQLVLRLPMGAMTNIEELHRELDRRSIQFDQQCARYDPGLFYTLRPGRCDFRSREFSTHYEINRIGVRDDEASLDTPEIVVAGDSFAMGWGVEQDQTFAQLLEQRTGRRVLNTAVASYGTVREMRMLDRVDLFHARHLILQYCANDAWENVPFLRKGEHLEGPETAYLDAMRLNQQGQRYWFGRYSWWLLQRFLERYVPTETPIGAQAETAPDEEPLPVQAEAFVNALLHAPHQKLDHVQLVVLATYAPGFLDAVAELIEKRPDMPPWIRNMRIVRLEPSPERYILDDHWTPAGHREVADLLLPLVAH
jgi:hypothetical protein